MDESGQVKKRALKGKWEQLCFFLKSLKDQSDWYYPQYTNIHVGPAITDLELYTYGVVTLIRNHLYYILYKIKIASRSWDRAL